MADVRVVWLAAFMALALGVTACTAATDSTSTAPEPTPAATISIMPKGDLPVVQAPTTSSATTTAPAPPPGVPVTTSPPAPPPGVPVTTSPPAVVPANPGLVIEATSLRLPRPDKTTVVPLPRPACTPGVSPAPTIRDVYPNRGDVKGGTDILITGTNLDLGPGTMVMFGSTAIAPWSLSSAALSVIAPPGAAGPITLKLSHPGGCNVTAQFTYVDPNAPVTSAPSSAKSTTAPPTTAPPTTAPPTTAPPTTGPPTTAPPTIPAVNGPCPGGSAPPKITGALPRTLLTLGGETVEIFGQGFATGSGQTAVFMGGVQVTPTSVTATRIRFTSPPSQPGPITLKVAVPLGCTTYAASDLKVVVPKPVVTSASPSQGPKAGGTAVVITGRYLANASVKVASTPATVTANSDTSITIVLPSVRYAGNASLSVTTPGGSAGLIFKYTP